MTYTTITNEQGLPGVRHLSLMIDGIRRRLKQRAEYRRTHRALQNLSNRELADIGVRRSEICEIARHHAHID